MPAFLFITLLASFAYGKLHSYEILNGDIYDDNTKLYISKFSEMPMLKLLQSHKKVEVSNETKNEADNSKEKNHVPEW